MVSKVKRVYRGWLAKLGPLAFRVRVEASAHRDKPVHRAKPVRRVILVLQAPMEPTALLGQLDRPDGRGRLAARGPQVCKVPLG